MAVKKSSPAKSVKKNGRSKTASLPAQATPHDEPEERQVSTSTSGPTIVGIAGSAGALSALQTFFSALPNETGMAFVVVTHLSPEHESHLASLLQPHTHMTVTQVTHKLPVRANQVYVIPPSRNILISDAHVDVTEFDEPRSKRAPVDFFFRTLGRSRREAVAIILSGGGTDGSVGMKDIKEEGGLVMVQDPEEAEYPSMPNAAIGTGLVDVVLPVQELATRLMRYSKHIPTMALDPETLDDQEWGLIQNILAQVQRRTKHDFSQYKRSTVLRRIRRRMVLNSHSSLQAYLDYIRQHPAESFALLNDLLIGVTNFFRDHEAWDALAREVLPDIFKHKDISEPIRVWSVGCASGEEAYSLAMLLLEAGAALDENRTMQVFASDIDDDALARAREGLYPAAIEADVSPERLERFFVRQGDHYQVRRELRDMILFTPHSVLRDPPFSHQDLIVCRNLLIYLQRDIQQYVLDIFHYALSLGGYLFVGNSESVSGKEAFFQTVDKKHRIYQAMPWRADQARVPSLPLTVRHPERGSQVTAPRPMVPRLPVEPMILEEQHRSSLEAYGPPSLLVSSDYSILHTSESAGRYLLQPKGPITSDVLKLVRPELQPEVRSALFQAFDKARSSVSPPIIVDFEGQERQVILSVYPRKSETDTARRARSQALMVFLEDEVRGPSKGEESQPQAESKGESKARLVLLQAETQRLRDQLQTTTEEYESSTEEMKAANEELQSINEEYHLTTEELETSKEELEAVNEELQTVNTELKSKLEEISRTHKDLESVMGAMEIATLFLDRQLRIQRYTPALSQFFHIMKTDIGRPIDHLKQNLANYSDLTRDAARVLDSLTVVDREVQADAGRWFLIRLRPYRTMEDRIEGVVITFVDITETKEASLALQHLNDTLEARVESRTGELAASNRRLEQSSVMFSMLFNVNPIPTSLTRMEDGLFLDANEAYARFFGLERDQIVGQTSLVLSLPFRNPERAQVVARLRRQGEIRDMEMELTRQSGDVHIVLASLQRVMLDGTEAMLSTFIDITDRVRAERQIRALAANLTAAEQRERHRISQVLHDDLQQRLFAIKMQLGFLQQAYQDGNQEVVDADKQSLDDALAQAIDTTRRLSIDLSPVILQGASLQDAFAWLKEEVYQRYNLEVDVQTDGDVPNVEDHLRVLLFNTLRELLFNVVKHSGTNQATLAVDGSDGRLQIVLTDHGKGFDAKAVLSDPKAAHGLLELRNRLSLLGCKMEVISQPGDGTEIKIEVPS